MAMIENIRNRQGLLIFMIGLGMLGFLIPYDAVMALFGQGGSRDVGEVAGVEISALEYQSELQERRRLGFTGDQLASEVWNDLTSGIILQDDFDALGLTVSNEEFQEIIFGSGYSPYINRAFYSNAENKQFWKQNFGAMLNTSQGKSDFLSYKRLIVEKRKREKYDNLITNGIYANSLEGESDYLQANRKVSFKYVLKSFVTIPDSAVSVSESDVKSYYKQHKSDPEFKATAGRNVTYVRISVKASTDDAAAIERDLTELKGAWASNSTSDEEFALTVSNGSYQALSLKKADVETDINEAGFFDGQVGDFVGPYLQGQNYRLSKIVGFSEEPDSVSCRHILLQATNASDETEMATLIARADSLKGALRAGATFEDLAAKHSDDPGSKANGGFYDFFTRGRMVAPFENFCFENKPGTVEAVETNFGVHLIEIMDHTKSMRKVSVAVIDRPLAPSSETLRNAKKDAREFAKNANDKDSFMSAAGDAGYPTNMASDIRRGAISISGLRNAAEVVSWAFNSEESEVSKPFLIDEAYVVAFLDQVSKDGIPPFDHVKEAMRTGATREAKADLYVAQMGSGTLEEIATAVNTKVLTTNNMALKFPTIKTAGALAEPEVVGLALAIPIGNISQPIVGENGVWVISPISIAEADEKTDFLTEQSNLLARARGAATLRVSNAMLEAANVVDNRSSN